MSILGTLNPAAKASVVFLLAKIVTSAISYISTPVYTRLLSASDFGCVNVFMTWQQIFGIVAMFCLSYGIFNNGMLDYPDKRDEYSFSMLVLSNIITVAFFVLLWIVYPFVGLYVDLEPSYYILLFFFFIISPAFSFWAAKQRYELKSRNLAIASILISFASPIVAIVCIYLFPNNKLNARIFGAEGIMIFAYFIFYVRICWKTKLRLNTSYWKNALLFNLPLIPHYLSAFLLNSSDRVMISRIIGNSETAYYSVACSIASVAIVFWTAVNSSLVPTTYECCKKKDYAKISSVCSPILVFFFLGCLLIVLLSPEIISLMATAEYKNAIYVIPPLICGVFFQVLYYLFANILFYFKKTKYVMIGSLTATVMNIFLNFILIEKYGYVAAGFTTLFCYGLQAVIDFIAMKKIAGVYIYNLKIIIFLSLILVFVSMVSEFLYAYSILRIGLLFAILLVLLFSKRKILEVLAHMKKKPSVEC